MFWQLHLTVDSYEGTANHLLYPLFSNPVNPIPHSTAASQYHTAV